MNSKEMFQELTFTPHRYSSKGVSARKEFDNGCLISVVSGEGLYGDLDANEFYDSTFEVAAFDADGEFIRLTPHDDVIGHRSLEEVSQIMTQLQNNPESLRVDEFTDY
tara:strand:- start:137 stop:460 length:324 start_codon:yes stop_codon:yes gene_type:complete